MEFPLIDPIVFSIGPFDVRWYALAYLAGFILGWRYALYLAGLYPESKPSREEIDDFWTWAIIAVILGGRMGYVLFYNLENYIQYPFTPVQIYELEFFIPSFLAIWQGGMSFHGGMLGMIIALIVFAKFKQIPLLNLSDIICCVVPIGLFFGRIANFINAELYGRVTTSPWGIVFPGAGDEPRHPSQLYEAFLEGAVLFVILMILVKFRFLEKAPGVISGVFLLGYGSFRFLVEYVREPDAHLGLIGEFISMGQILSLPMILIGLGLAAVSLNKTKMHDVKI